MIAGVLALATSQASAQYLNQSAPFSLVLSSDNATINGSALIACHEGAAIEGLCIGAAVAGARVSSYTFNFSSAATPDPTIGVTGLLTYELRGGNFNLSSPMQLSYNPASNVAVPLFMPAEYGQEVAFDPDNKMAIVGYLDDRLAPSPSPYDPKRLYRWYVCTTYAGYVYQTLAWALGEAEPQNPTCEKVDVVRVFV